MRKRVQMTYIRGENKKGYMGHWGMNYYVDNVKDVATGELICSEYVFRQSKIFKGKGFKTGDQIEMDITISQSGNTVKLSYYSNIKKVGEQDG